MKKQQKPFVIAVSAVAGGGKTSVTKRLTEKLNHSRALYFDEYEFPKEPNDICEWVENGSDLNEWDLTPFVDDLASLVTNEPAFDYVLLDYPFADAQEDMNRYIDFTVFIDTPLDVAMARRILRDFTDGNIVSVREDMKIYLHNGRFAYLNMLKNTKPRSDFIVNGLMPLDEVVEAIISEIHKRSM